MKIVRICIVLSVLLAVSIARAEKISLVGATVINPADGKALPNGKTPTAWVVKDASGKVLRKFHDTTGEGGVNLIAFYRDGEEVWRQGETGHTAFYILTPEDVGLLLGSRPELRDTWQEPAAGERPGCHQTTRSVTAAREKPPRPPVLRQRRVCPATAVRPPRRLWIRLLAYCAMQPAISFRTTSLPLRNVVRAEPANAIRYRAASAR